MSSNPYFKLETFLVRKKTKIVTCCQSELVKGSFRLSSVRYSKPFVNYLLSNLHNVTYHKINFVCYT